MSVPGGPVPARTVVLRLLGEVEAQRDLVAAAIPSARHRMLLARIADAGYASVAVGQLIDELWDQPTATARNAIQVAVSTIRRALGPEVITSSDAGYAIGRGVDVDTVAFRREISEGLALRERDDLAALALLTRAITRWNGVPLGGLPDAPFVRTVRAELRERFLTAVEASAAIRIEQGQSATVLPDLLPIAAEHPFQEGLAAQAMLALAVVGRQSDALELFDRTRALLVDELGIDPGAALRTARDRVLREQLPSATAARRTVRLGLPEQPGPLIGRDEELAAVIERFGEPSVRLVTITGMGGVGKTRLAQAVVERSTGPAAFATLTSAERIEDVPSTIARELEVEVGSGEAEDALVAALAPQSDGFLLVIDNFEHVAGAAPLVGRLLARLPALRVLATSRRALDIPSESPIEIGPLPVSATVDDPMGAAGRLLLHHIRRAAPDLRPAGDELAELRRIAEVCDGIPLALELAGARAGVLSLQEIRERLEESLASLESDSDLVRADHRSLAASLRWSLDSLRPATGAMLTTLTSFVGGFTLESAAAVAGVSDADAEELLDQLLRHSLVHRQAHGRHRRFDLVRVVGEAARSRASDETLLLHKRAHLRYFRSRTAGRPRGSRFFTTLQRLQDTVADWPNYREAIRWALGTDPQAAFDLVFAVGGSETADEAEVAQWLDRLDAAAASDADRFEVAARRLTFTSGSGDRSIDELIADAERLAPVAGRQALRAFTYEKAFRLLAYEGDLEGVSAGLRVLAEDPPGDDLALEILIEALAALVELHGRGDPAGIRAAHARAVEAGYSNLAVNLAHDVSEGLLWRGAAAEAAEISLEILVNTPASARYARSGAFLNHAASLLMLGHPTEAETSLRSAASLMAGTKWLGEKLEVVLRIACCLTAADDQGIGGAFEYAVWRSARETLGWSPSPADELLIARYIPSERPIGAAHEDDAAAAVVAGSGPAESVESVLQSFLLGASVREVSTA